MIELAFAAALMGIANQAGWMRGLDEHSIPQLGVTVLLPVWLLSLWFDLTLSVKRLHDLGLGRLHCFWITGLLAISSVLDILVNSEEHPLLSGVRTLLDVMCVLVLLWLLFWPGQHAPNRFGPAPGSRVAEAF